MTDIHCLYVFSGMHDTLHFPESWNSEVLLLWKERFLSIPLWMLAMTIAAGVTGAVAVYAVEEKIGICYGEETMLSYARYNKRGNIVDRVYRCGIPHATCKIRDMSVANPVYDCSQFMLPKGMVSWK